ncbi:Hypothetical protein DEACI_1353 [Acididesulfobacillus acetoxydans]|uniref:Uncharacterized protein n=1 Tax=Acididesulfobacillus acetoxydans TaxID=1561005 RepID=A0A8S0X4C4_9FIRM|nr:Hypothetical protein DEACI_1353 [Acididesulfobacillus acetoxydans]CEJ09481.1 Hypothetical protein DEACI_3965 [Acididesulfobacillus acetoxydans]
MLKLNIETSVRESTPDEAEYGVPLSLVEVGISRLDEILSERIKVWLVITKKTLNGPKQKRNAN